MQAARLPSMAQPHRSSHPQGSSLPAARRWPLPAAVTVAPPPPPSAAASSSRQQPAPHRRPQPQQHQQPLLRTSVAARAEAAGSSSSSSSSSSGSSGGAPPPPAAAAGGGGGLFARLFSRFDRLPAQTQMVVLTVLGLTAFSVVPFLQPTFLYGNGSSSDVQSNNVATVVPALPASASKRARRAADKAAEKAAAAAAVARAEAEAAEAAKYQRMREIPVAGPVLGYLQDCAMPKKLPDGRTESPGALRIYLASLILLGFFYAASAVLQGLINLFVAALVQVGILKVRRPATPPPGQQQQQQGGASSNPATA